MHAELKALETRKVYLETHLADARRRSEDASASAAKARREAEKFQSELQDVYHKINRLKLLAKGLVITEHAILRYLERVMGLDLEDVKREMCGGRDPKEIDPTGLLLLPVGTTHKLRIQEGVVVTVLTNDGGGK